MVSQAELIFNMVIAVLGTGTLATIVGAIINRRKTKAETGKLGAEAVQVLAAASASMVTPMREEIERLTAQVARVTTRADTVENKLREVTTNLRYAKDQTSQLSKEVHDLRKELQRYRDHYGELPQEEKI